MSKAASTWRVAPGFPGYEVSMVGDVRSWLPERRYAARPTKPRAHKFTIDRYGYKKVVLRVDMKRVTIFVHRLVLLAWYGAPRGRAVGRHLDGNRQNNAVANLRWGTPKQNSDDSRRHGTLVQGTRVNTAKLTEAAVRFVRRSPDGHSALARRFGVSPGAIWHIRAGRTWRHVS